MTSQQTAPAPSPLLLQFDDNRLLPLLYGDFDRHLARIEQALDVSLSSRGNTVTITGDADSLAIARTTLNALYGRLEEGLPVGGYRMDESWIDIGLPEEYARAQKE